MDIQYAEPADPILDALLASVAAAYRGAIRAKMAHLLHLVSGVAPEPPAPVLTIEPQSHMGRTTLVPTRARRGAVQAMALAFVRSREPDGATISQFRDAYPDVPRSSTSMSFRQNIKCGVFRADEMGSRFFIHPDYGKTAATDAATDAAAIDRLL